MPPLVKTATVAAISAFTIGAAIACSSSSTTSPSTQAAAGTYVLKQLNGQDVGTKSYVIEGGDTVIVTADTIILVSNATYTKDAVDTLRSVSVTPMHRVASGTYTLSGTSVTFTNSTTGTTANGQLVNGALTASDTVNGVILTGVFNKQ